MLNLKKKMTSKSTSCGSWKSDLAKTNKLFVAIEAIVEAMLALTQAPRLTAMRDFLQ